MMETCGLAVANPIPFRDVSAGNDTPTEAGWFPDRTLQGR